MYITTTDGEVTTASFVNLIIHLALHCRQRQGFRWYECSCSFPFGNRRYNEIRCQVGMHRMHIVVVQVQVSAIRSGESIADALEEELP